MGFGKMELSETGFSKMGFGDTGRHQNNFISHVTTAQVDFITYWYWQ